MIDYRCRQEHWPLRAPFRIARETIAALPLVHLELRDDGVVGHAEAAGVDYRGETPSLMIAQIETYLDGLNDLPTRAKLLRDLPPGGARNAIDCALWDLDAKRGQIDIWHAIGLHAPAERRCAYTISLDSPASMARAFSDAPDGSVLKLKLGGRDGLDRLRVEEVRKVAPQSTIIVDANEGWTLQTLNRLAPILEELGVELIEQPIPAGEDSTLARYRGNVPLCADESFDDASSLERLGAYACVNIKLDKAGGLTAGLQAAACARERGYDLFVGSMLGTSLGMAPAFVIAQQCRYVDLDGPLWLANDRQPAMEYRDAMIQPFDKALWG